MTYSWQSAWVLFIYQFVVEAIDYLVHLIRVWMAANHV